MHEHANATYQELHINDVKSEDLMDVMEGHIGRGYGVSSDDELGKYESFRSNLQSSN